MSQKCKTINTSISTSTGPMLKLDHTTVFIRMTDNIQNYMTQLTVNIKDKYRNKNGNWLLENIIFRLRKNQTKTKTIMARNNLKAISGITLIHPFLKKHMMQATPGIKWRKHHSLSHRLSVASQLGSSPTLLRPALSQSSKSMW